MQVPPKHQPDIESLLSTSPSSVQRKRLEKLASAVTPPSKRSLTGATSPTNEVVGASRFRMRQKNDEVFEKARSTVLERRRDASGPELNKVLSLLLTTYVKDAKLDGQRSGKGVPTVMVPSLENMILLLGSERARLQQHAGSNAEFAEHVARQIRWLIAELGQAKELAEVREEQCHLLLEDCIAAEETMAAAQKKREESEANLRDLFQTMAAERSTTAQIIADLEKQAAGLRERLCSALENQGTLGPRGSMSHLSAADTSKLPHKKSSLHRKQKDVKEADPDSTTTTIVLPPISPSNLSGGCSFDEKADMLQQIATLKRANGDLSRQMSVLEDKVEMANKEMQDEKRNVLIERNSAQQQAENYKAMLIEIRDAHLKDTADLEQAHTEDQRKLCEQERTVKDLRQQLSDASTKLIELQKTLLSGSSVQTLLYNAVQPELAEEAAAGLDALTTNLQEYTRKLTANSLSPTPEGHPTNASLSAASPALRKGSFEGTLYKALHRRSTLTGNTPARNDVIMVDEETSAPMPTYACKHTSTTPRAVMHVGTQVEMVADAPPPLESSLPIPAVESTESVDDATAVRHQSTAAPQNPTMESQATEKPLPTAEAERTSPPAAASRDESPQSVAKVVRSPVAATQQATPQGDATSPLSSPKPTPSQARPVDGASPNKTSPVLQQEAQRQPSRRDSKKTEELVVAHPIQRKLKSKHSIRKPSAAVPLSSPLSEEPTDSGSGDALPERVHRVVLERRPTETAIPAPQFDGSSEVIKYIEQLSESRQTCTQLKERLIEATRKLEETQASLSKREEEAAAFQLRFDRKEREVNDVRLKLEAEKASGEKISLRYQQSFLETARLHEEYADLKGKSEEETRQLQNVIADLQSQVTHLSLGEQRMHLRNRERMLCEVAERFVRGVGSASTAVTCHVCLEPLLHPLTLFPCGHILCEQCFLVSNEQRGLNLPREAEAGLAAMRKVENETQRHASLAVAQLSPSSKPLSSGVNAVQLAEVAFKARVRSMKPITQGPMRSARQSGMNCVSTPTEGGSNHVMYCAECDRCTVTHYTNSSRVEEVVEKLIFSGKEAVDIKQLIISSCVQDYVENQVAEGAGGSPPKKVECPKFVLVDTSASARMQLRHETELEPDESVIEADEDDIPNDGN